MYRKTCMPSARLHPGTLSAKLLAKFLLVCVSRNGNTGKKAPNSRPCNADLRNSRTNAGIC